MAEIQDAPWNGLNVVSTFAGGGGSSTGYRMAGYRVLLASEFVEAARETYRANAGPHTKIDPRDIRKVSGAEILEQIGLGVGELDVFDGSPPCAAFSMAGKREKSWGKVEQYSDTAQRKDDLFFEFARLVDEMRPKVFVAENVSGLIKGIAKGYFLEILAALKAAGDGYRVRAKLLDAQWLGVPQARQRLIFVGVRDDLNREPAFPKPLPYRYSIRDALPADSAIEPESDISRYAIGKEWGRIGLGKYSRRYHQLIRAKLTNPSPTITALGGEPSRASVTHPTERRKFSIAELKRICGFPDDYVLKGTYKQQWERLGRSVPPLMMKSIAEAIRDEVLS